MRKLIIKGIVFVVIVCSICAYFLSLSAKEPTRSAIAKWTDSEEFMSASGMLPFFEKARQQNGTTQLLIGDSICSQMFNGVVGYNPETSILSTNAALMITGQYLLAEEYLKNHPDATDVFLVMHPLTITRTIDTEWSYRYAVMTYVETDTLQYLDDNTVDAMEDTFGRFFLNSKVVQLVEDSPVARKLCLSYLNTSREDYVQSSPFEIADQYVRKLYELCEEKGVTLHFYSSPVSEYYREDMEELLPVYNETWMSTVYPDYMNDIWYYPLEWTEDMSHFSGEYAERSKLNESIREAYKQTVLLERLKLE